MITNVETLVNEYWMYPDEPFNMIRFICDGHRYLFGENMRRSAGIDKSLGKGYEYPTEEMMEEVIKCLNTH